MQHPTLKELIQLSKDREYREIIRLLDAIPPMERSTTETFYLAKSIVERYDWPSPPYLEQLQRVPGLIQSIRNDKSFPNTGIQLDRLQGEALYAMAEYKQALPLLQKVLRREPDDDDTELLIDNCNAAIRHPAEKESFRVRTAKAWTEFAQQNDTIRALLADTENAKSRKKAAAALKRILRNAFPNPSFSVGYVKQMELPWMQIDAFSKTELLQVLYFLRHAPESIQDSWTFYPGWPIATRSELESVQALCRSEVLVKISPEVNGRVVLFLFCPDTDESFIQLGDRVGAMNVSLRILGSMIHSTFVVRAIFLDRRPEGELVPLEDLLYALSNRGLVEDPFDTDSMELRRFPYEADEIPDEFDMEYEKVWRTDIFSGCSADINISNEYDCDTTFIASHLAGSGAIPGFAVFPLRGSPMQRDNLLPDLMAELEAALDPEDGTVLGYFEGVHFGYLDILAWDRQAVLDVLKPLLQGRKFAWAAWHSFFRYDRTLPIF